MSKQKTKTIRSWGWYEVIHELPGAKIKTLCVKPGGQLSMQRHAHRSEHWSVISGTGSAYVDGTVYPISAKSCLVIPVGSWHTLANFGSDDLLIVEVQHGPICSEDDIERVPHLESQQQQLRKA